MSLCALALVLLLDTSGSLEDQNILQQLEGHARAFESEEVISAVERSGSIAVRAVGYSHETVEIAGWTLLNNPEDARNFAVRLRLVNPQMLDRTGTLTYAALEDARVSFQSVPCEPERMVIDVVTDGISDDRPRRLQVIPTIVEENITINALFVETPTGQERSEAAGFETGLDWIKEEVVTPYGFAYAIDGWQRFVEAIKRKIILELAIR